MDGCIDMVGCINITADTWREPVAHAQQGGELGHGTAAERTEFTRKCGEMFQTLAATAEFHFAEWGGDYMQEHCNVGISYGFERQYACSAVPVRWQRRPEYGDPVYQWPVSRFPTDPWICPQDQVIPLNDKLGLHSTMGPLKDFWDAGKPAIFLGIGYPHPSYSHFRSIDIWHPCEPVKVGIEGWLGQAIKEFDPQAENVLTGVNYGRGWPGCGERGRPVASVGNLDIYGPLTGIEGEIRERRR